MKYFDYNKIANWKFELSTVHKLSIFHTFFLTFFNLLPLILGLALAKFSNNWKGWYEFYKNGEFYIYAVSSMSSAFLVYYTFKKKVYDTESYLGIFCMVSILILSALYGLKASNLMTSINVDFLKWTSCGFLVVAILVFYNSQLIYFRRSPDIASMRNTEQNNIVDQLN
jgi:hypothetical protein